MFSISSSISNSSSSSSSTTITKTKSGASNIKSSITGGGYTIKNAPICVPNGAFKFAKSLQSIKKN